MVSSAIMAFLHHLAAFGVVATLAVEVALFKPPLTLSQARRIQIADTLFGAAASVVLVVGLLRVFYFEKGASYYFHNSYFSAKFGLFILAALISIYPTVVFLSWKKSIKAGEVPQLSATQTRRVRMCLMLELTAVVGILFCAPFMARGLGYHP